MLGPFHRYRGMALLPLAALAVHQLRYLLAFGAGAEQRLADEGHSYLGSIEAVAIVLCAVALGGFLTHLASAWCGRAAAGTDAAPSPRRGLLKLWAVAALVLAGIYTGQELLEGFLVAGHPPGVEGVLGHGGWLMAPLSLAIGGLLALLLRGAQAVLALVRRAVAARPRPAAEPAPRLRPARVLLRRVDPLAGAAAGRAPPVRALVPA
ncbi:hypothetical protein [Conexibacter woesei]|uniref:Uncharacterized protein n=1 Tax=Conexibacter woesei (strain DSM 14684 / CCUG 47730 / CIP 108061 / JCM 11494 / NBRC 100937 / ID131577) TaxID=469383 RepID=D3F2P8_CONWI|nr:hypothetical protein [Conexibacter woesei]ADB54179.1 hypothetical protein Cwoe_5778 [Conexibacter woesei DSM 14684]